MGNFNSNFEKPLEFRTIILEQLKKILEISSHELRDTTIILNHGNYSTTSIQEDTRLSYIQAVENLAYTLLPYFDEQTKKVYDECLPIITALFNFEIPKVILKEEYESVCKQMGKDVDIDSFAKKTKLKYAKKLFCELNLLLKRNDYLSSSVYGEDGNDEVVEEDGDGESPE